MRVEAFKSEMVPRSRPLDCSAFDALARRESRRAYGIAQCPGHSSA